MSSSVLPVQQLQLYLDRLNLWDGHHTLQRNEYLSVKGDVDCRLYFVVSGSVRVYIVDGVEEHIIRFGYRDSFITSLDSFITEKPTVFYTQAIKKSELKSISKKAFINFIKSDAAIMELWDTTLQQLVYGQLEREIDILTSSPIERYKRVLKRSPHLFQQVPHKYIASYLRMTPETLSRLKKS